MFIKEQIEPCRYRVDEYSKKQKRWLLGVVTYRDSKRGLRCLKRILEENERDGIETRVIDLFET